VAKPIEERAPLVSRKKIVTPPSMLNKSNSNTIEETRLGTIDEISEPVSSTERASTPKDENPTRSVDSGELTSWWSFVACCSLAYIFGKNIESSPDNISVPVSGSSPKAATSDTDGISAVEKYPSTVHYKESNAKLEERDNIDLHISLVEAPREISRLKSSSHELIELVSRNSATSIHDNPRMDKKTIWRESSSVGSKTNESSESCARSEMTDAASSFGETESQEDSIEQTNSYSTETSDTVTGLSLFENSTETTSFDSHDASLPWWQLLEELNSVDSSDWSHPYIDDKSVAQTASQIDGIWTVPTLTEYSQAHLMLSESQFSTISFDSDDETSSECELDESDVDEDPSARDKDAKQVKSCESITLSNLNEKNIERGTRASGGSLENESLSVARTSPNGSSESGLTAKEILETMSVSETEMAVAGTAQCVERKRIRVFSKAVSQNVARNIHRRASKMKAKRSARRNQALLVKSGISVHEELPAIVETNESSNASSNTTHEEAQVTWTKSGIEVDDATIRSTNGAEGMAAPPVSGSPRSIFDIKIPREIKTPVTSNHPELIPPANSSFNDAIHGEFEIYMV
jgi:hypothetical protein